MTDTVKCQQHNITCTDRVEMDGWTDTTNHSILPANAVGNNNTNVNVYSAVVLITATARVKQFT